LKEGRLILNMLRRVSLAVNLYNWDFYPSIKALKEYRTQALRQFISDYPAGIIEKRYINAELPKMPFDDKSFDLVKWALPFYI
jgi:ubiquinone/menaquinone biosynthesis C-methylase UbiE